MTKREFIRNIPNVIVHGTSGEALIEIIEDSPTIKNVCYRHTNNTASFATLGSSWQDVYDELMSDLKKWGYVK